MILKLQWSAARLAFEPINESAIPSSDPSPSASIQRALVNAPTAVLLVNEIERREVELRRARNNMLPKLEVEFAGATNNTRSNGSGGNGWEGVALARISLPWTFPRRTRAARTGARQSQKASMQKWQEQLQRHREGLVPVRELRDAEEDLRTSEMRVLDAWSTLGQLDGTIAQRHNFSL